MFLLSQNDQIGYDQILRSCLQLLFVFVCSRLRLYFILTMKIRKLSFVDLFVFDKSTRLTNVN